MLTVKKTLSLCILLLLPIFTSNNATSATDNTGENSALFLLQQIAQAPQLKSKQPQWLPFVQQPDNSQHYYLANKQGQIFQLEQGGVENTTLLIDLKKVLANQPQLQLSAFSLHPNFSQFGQLGFNTFYTAHVEKFSDAKESHRISELAHSKTMPLDSVITEWKLTVKQTIDDSSYREILRVAIPSTESAINQLSFNPYRKSWHEDFSQLYLSLPASPKLKQLPLYSGAILRIHPDKTATGSFSTPHSNPYYANERYEETLYIFGIGNIKQFLWPEKHSPKLLISHQYSLNSSTKLWLSYGDSGDNWQKSPPKEFLYQAQQAISVNKLLVYRGQNAPQLRNKVLLLTKNKQVWQISSLPEEINLDKSNLSKLESLNNLKVEWQLHRPLLSAKHLSIYTDNLGELLLFNEDEGALHQVFQRDNALISPSEQPSSFSIISIFLFIIIALLLGYVFYQSKAHQTSAKAFVRREFAALTLSNDGSTLNLYRRHQTKIEKSILLNDINQCQVMLGNLVILTINTTHRYGFSNLHEQELREVFHTEQIDKMVDGKVRQINLVVNTYQKHRFIICLYLRKGSDRITKKSYFDVVDDVINWCWLISTSINNTHTEKRSSEAERKSTNTSQPEHKCSDDTPLHKQAAIIRPATHLHKQGIAEQQSEQLTETQPSTNNSETVMNSIKAEAELVNAIEKLGKLHQQGFLSEDEFKQAKAKLLESLTKTE